MKSFRFLHIADIHADGEPTRQKKLQESFNQIKGYCNVQLYENKRIDAVIIAGDVFERKQSYAEKSGVPMVQQFLKELSCSVENIFIVKGNNAHDEPGSIALLDQLEKNIHAYEYPTILGVYGEQHDTVVVDILRDLEEVKSWEDGPSYIVSLMPYPTKASLLKDASIDDNNENFGEIFDSIMDTFGDIHSKYNCPKILGIHANIQGSRLSSGQTLISQDIIIAPSSLYRAQADYYAAGHIHLRQEVASRIWYSGSLYNCNWGETEQKSFNVIEFCEECYDNFLRMEPYEAKVKVIPLAASKPMITVDLVYRGSFAETIAESNQTLAIEDMEAIAQGIAEVRLKIKVNENDRKLITEGFIQELKKEFGEDVKIDWNIIPNERDSRSEKIMTCKSLVDEVQEYAAVVNEAVTDSMKEKVLKIQGQEVAV